MRKVQDIRFDLNRIRIQHLLQRLRSLQVTSAENVIQLKNQQNSRQRLHFPII
jgi:hypothetical protein